MPKRHRERDNTPLGPLTGAQIEQLVRTRSGEGSSARIALAPERPPLTVTQHQQQQFQQYNQHQLQLQQYHQQQQQFHQTVQQAQQVQQFPFPVASVQPQQQTVGPGAQQAPWQNLNPTFFGC